LGAPELRCGGENSVAFLLASSALLNLEAYTEQATANSSIAAQNTASSAYIPISSGEKVEYLDEILKDSGDCSALSIEH
jgi:hypothetical protein